MITAVLYNTVTGGILKRDCEIDELNPPVINPNLKYYIPYEPYPIPEYDSRYYSCPDTGGMPTDIDHPGYPAFKQWLIEHPLIKKELVDICKSVDNAERLANSTIIKNENQLTFFSNGLLLFFKSNAGIELTPEEEQSILDMSIKCGKIVTNRDIATEKKAAIMLGEEPDIDSLWLKE
jgi:hypothetical protein